MRGGTQLHVWFDGISVRSLCAGPGKTWDELHPAVKEMRDSLLQSWDTKFNMSDPLVGLIALTDPCHKSLRFLSQPDADAARTRFRAEVRELALHDFKKRNPAPAAAAASNGGGGDGNAAAAAANGGHAPAPPVPDDDDDFGFNSNVAAGAVGVRLCLCFWHCKV